MGDSPKGVKMKTMEEVKKLLKLALINNAETTRNPLINSGKTAVIRYFLTGVSPTLTFVLM